MVSPSSWDAILLTSLILLFFLLWQGVYAGLRALERGGMMSSSEAGPKELDPLPRDDHFLAEVQRELGRLTREMRSPEATLDLLFLAYLIKTSRFGYFSFGPVTIDVRLIEDLVTRTTVHSSGPEAGDKAPYSDDCLRFLRVLTDEVERSGRRRIDDVHFLLAFMQVREDRGACFRSLG
jgi:hypothetical protein